MMVSAGQLVPSLTGFYHRLVDLGLTTKEGGNEVRGGGWLSQKSLVRVESGVFSFG